MLVLIKNTKRSNMAFKLQGMDFGEGTNRNKSVRDMLDSMPIQNSAYNKFKNYVKASDNPNSDFDTRTKKGRNLFGQEREVTKYYDPETGKKLGKKVTVKRGDRPDKVKTKRVNRGLTQEGGVGKIRVDSDYFDKTMTTPPKSPGGEANVPSETNINRSQRAAEIKDKNVTYDEKGNPRIPKYKQVFDKFEKTEDGKYINPRNKKQYSNLNEFIEDAESWWAKQAEKTKNEKLKKQNQEYGLDAEGNVKFSKSPTKKIKRGYKQKKK